MKVCFISCHYPPLSRTWRRYQFARYLADGGCQVEVVTHGNVSRALGAFVEDADTMANDPRIPVHRPRALPWHLAGEVLHRGGVIPCPHFNWLRPAAKTAAAIATAANSAILSVYPPLTDHMAARLAARQTGARLVLDYRDEFLDLATGLRRPLAKRVEPWLVRSADLISVATQDVADKLLQRYNLTPDKIQITHNGYWQEGRTDFPGRRRMQVVYAGALSGAQGVEVIGRALDILWRRQPQVAELIEVKIYGPDNLYLRQKVLPQLGRGVSYGGFLSAGQIPEVLANADAGFLALADQRYAYAIPGKLYEYIAHALPVVAALPHGSASQLIETEGFGLVAPCGQPEILAHRLAQMVDLQQRSGFYQRLLGGRDRFAAKPHFLALAKRIRELGQC